MLLDCGLWGSRSKSEYKRIRGSVCTSEKRSFVMVSWSRSVGELPYSRSKAHTAYRAKFRSNRFSYL